MRDAAAQLVPEGIVRPFLERIVHGGLDVIAAQVVVAHRAQRKAARVVGIDQLVADRGGAAENAQPAKGIDTLVGAQHVGGNGLARGAVKPVAAGDPVAVDPRAGAVAREGHMRRVAVQVMQRDILAIMQDHTIHRVAGIVEVGRHLGLAVDDHRAADQFLEIYAKVTVARGQVGAFMHEALARHAVTDAGLAQQARAALFKHAGPDAAKHMRARAALQHDAVNAGAVKQLAEKQARRPAADDTDLSAHE